MNEFVQGAIDVRRRTLLDAYVIRDPIFHERMREVFDEMAELGESCPDAADFEAALAQSPANARYYDLCAHAATSFQPRQADTQIPDSSLTPGEIAQRVADRGERLLDSATGPIRRAVYEERRQQIEDIPVVGDLMQASRTMSVLKKWFKK